MKPPMLQVCKTAKSFWPVILKYLWEKAWTSMFYWPSSFLDCPHFLSPYSLRRNPCTQEIAYKEYQDIRIKPFRLCLSLSCTRDFHLLLSLLRPTSNLLFFLLMPTSYLMFSVLRPTSFPIFFLLLPSSYLIPLTSLCPHLTWFSFSCMLTSPLMFSMLVLTSYLLPPDIFPAPAHHSSEVFYALAHIPSVPRRLFFAALQRIAITWSPK